MEKADGFQMTDINIESVGPPLLPQGFFGGIGHGWAVRRRSTVSRGIRFPVWAKG